MGVGVLARVGVAVGLVVDVDEAVGVAVGCDVDVDVPVGVVVTVGVAPVLLTVTLMVELPIEVVPLYA